MYVWDYDEWDDWGLAMDEMGGDGSWRTVVPQRQDSSVFGGTSACKYHACRIAKGVAPQYTSWWYIAQNLTSLGLLERYSRFVLTRTDHYYLCQLQLWPLNKSFIWIPEGQDYRGICDRLAVLSSDDILGFLNVFPPLVRNPKNYSKNMPHNSESLLKRRLKEQGLFNRVRRFKRSMFIATVQGDMSNWSYAVDCMLSDDLPYDISRVPCPHPFNQPNIIGAKKPQELKQAIKTCQV
jgi:hypothetical protein